MSFKKYDVFREVRELLMLAFPLVGAQLVMCLAGFVDTVMAGHYSSVDLAAVAVGYTVWIPVNVFLVGLFVDWHWQDGICGTAGGGRSL